MSTREGRFWWRWASVFALSGGMASCVGDLGGDVLDGEAGDPGLERDVAAEDWNPPPVSDPDPETIGEDTFPGGVTGEVDEDALEASLVLDDADLESDFEDPAEMYAASGADSDEVNEAWELEEMEWERTHSTGGSETESLDLGKGPAKKARFARGRIIHARRTGSVLGWACDTRNAKQPLVVLVTRRNQRGIIGRRAAVADKVPARKWIRKWIKNRCKGNPGHVFRVEFNKLGCGNVVGLKLVGHRDGQRYVVNRRKHRCSPVGKVRSYRVTRQERSRTLRAIRGWACDQDSHTGRVMVVVKSGKGVKRKHRTNVNHGRRIHIRCNGGKEHRFKFEMKRKVPCGEKETFRIFANNLGERGKRRLIGKRVVKGGRCPSSGGSGSGVDISAGSPHWGGAEDIIRNEVVPVARAAGVGSTSGKRTATYGNPGSDHHVSQTLASARDFGTANNYALRNRIMRRLGVTSAIRDYGSYYIKRGGHTFRVQPIAGTHGTGPHLHIGIRRID